jgi:hypothetical protein
MRVGDLMWSFDTLSVVTHILVVSYMDGRNRPTAYDGWVVWSKGV